MPSTQQPLSAGKLPRLETDVSLRCVSGASDKTRAFHSGAVEAFDACEVERRVFK